MNPFRQIAHDTASLLDDLRRGWSRLAWRLAWWRKRKGIEAERLRGEAENLRRSVAASTKMCRECRALIDASAATCPECGASTRRIRSGGPGRLVSLLVPGEITVSKVLVTAYFALFLAGVAISLRMPSEPGLERPGPLQVLMNLDARALVVTGANFGPLSGGAEPWRLLTAIFLHAGALHLAFNTMAMTVVGPLIEHLYGPRRMFVIYLLTGVLGNVASLWWHGPRLLQVGASGAIFGFIGLAAVYGFRRKDAAGEALRRHMVEWAIYGIVMGLLFRADNAAHLGGLVAGALFGMLLPDPHRAEGAMEGRAWTIAAALGVISTLGAFGLTALRWAGAS